MYRHKIANFTIKPSEITVSHDYGITFAVGNSKFDKQRTKVSKIKFK